MKIKDYIIIVLTFIVIVLMIVSFNRCGKKEYIDRETIVERWDTIIRIDTAKFKEPVYVWKKTVDTVKYFYNDTAFISLPREQAYYSDSTFDAWVSGINPKLDSIHTYNKEYFITHTIDRTINHYEKWGLMAGLGINSNFNNRVGVTANLGVEIKRNNFIIGYDFLNKDANFTYVYKFYRK